MAVDYSKVQFDTNTDYKALIDQENAKGVNANPTAIDTYNLQRAAKIYSDPNLTAQYETSIPQNYRKTAEPNIIPQPPPTAAPAPTQEQMQAPTYTPKYDTAQQYQELQNYPEYNPNPEYQTMISGLVKGLNEQFKYSPDNDPALQQAQAEVDRTIREEMGARGFLYSDETASIVAQEMGKLTGTYRTLAQNEWQQGLSNKLNIIQTVQGLMNADYQQYTDKYQRKSDFLNTTANLNAQDFQEFSTQWDQAYKSREEQRAIEKAQIDKMNADYDKAIERINTFGYVDNDSASITGIKAGTRTYEAEQAITKRKQELEDKQKDIAIQDKRDKEERAWQLQYLKEKNIADEAIAKRQTDADHKWQLEYLKAKEASDIRAYNATTAKTAKLTSGGGSGGSGTSTTSQKSAYASAVNSLGDINNVDTIAKQLVYYSADAQQLLGSNYSKLLNLSQDAYYNKLQGSWAGSRNEDIVSSLKGGEVVNIRDSNGNVISQPYGGKKDPDFYKKMLGNANYNKYMTSLTKKSSGNSTIDEIMNNLGK